jgi:uncharacterized membrane protein YkvA (DUF1232 family)
VTPRLGGPRLARLFTSYRRRAVDLVRDPEALDALARDARRRVDGASSSRIRALGDDVKRLGRLVRAFANGSYREVGTTNLVLAVAGILYFVTPVDLVPDFVPAGGLVDDATVLAFVLAKLRVELDRFAAWERADAITVGEPPEA